MEKETHIVGVRIRWELEDLSHHLCWNKEGMCHLTTRFPIIRSNWGRATSILLETSWILTAPPLSIMLFPETRPINLPDFLLLNQPYLVRGHYLQACVVLRTLGANQQGDPPSPGICCTPLKTLHPFPCCCSLLGLSSQIAVSFLE